MDYERALAATNSSYSNKTADVFKKNKELSSRIAKVYEDDDDNVFISYRGTDTSRVSDLVADAYIMRGLDKYSSRFQNSRDILIKTKNYYAESNKNIILTGHSMGGRHADRLASTEDGIHSAYTFNDGANPYFVLQDSLQDKLFHTNKTTPVYAYSTGTDILSTGIYVPRRNKTNTIISRKEGIDSHSLENFEL